MTSRNQKIKRGGDPESELCHAHLLLAGNASEIWGWGTPAGKERVSRRVQWIEKACGIKAGVKLLECGCGTGIFTKSLALSGASITAVDISPDLLRKAQGTCSDLDVTFLQANLEDPTNIPENYFDAICGVSVLHHLDVAQALPKLRSKLKRHGKFAFSEPNILNPINKYIIFSKDIEKRKKIGTSPNEMAFYPQELRNAFESAGFDVQTIEHRDFLHPSVPSFMIPYVKFVESIAEWAPGIRSMSGSLWISGQRN
jgi:2-polyprenyl-3-methyl-5-hydroxy-6-metoxy-1,4-benzoquinol methylase